MTDYALCAGFYTPCSASCIPLSLANLLKQAMSKAMIVKSFVSRRGLQTMLDEIPVEMISLPGREINRKYDS